VKKLILVTLVLQNCKD